MAYRNKTYVAFDADEDMRYYRLMQAWKQNDNTDFNFYDAHDLINGRVDTEEAIKRRLKERLSESKVFVLLVGSKTKNLYKYVRWEIEHALSLDLPIIVVNLNGKRAMDKDLCPPILKEELAIHISYNAKIIQYALENWLDSHKRHKKADESGAYYYEAKTYNSLGLAEYCIV